MDAAPLDRPLRNTTLLALAGVVHADPETVFGHLAERVRPDAAQVADPVRVPATAAAFSIDGPTRTVVAQGRWWYRAEWRVLPHEDGSRIEHEIVNIARVLPVAGEVAARGVLRAAPERFRDLLTHVAGASED